MKNKPFTLLTKDEELRLAKGSSFKADTRVFVTGAIRDKETEKEDYTETISWTAFKRYAQYMTGKKAKYGAGNFKLGIDIESYERSLLRHIQKYMENKYEGGVIEAEEDHLSACVFNIFGIMHEEGRINKQNVTSKTR
jgi:hypothetical protein